VISRSNPRLNRSVLFSRLFLALIGAGLVLVGLAGVSLTPAPAQAAAGINKTINYQGRLLNAAGAVVPDGTYNMEFQLWQGGTGCVSGCTSANAAVNNGGTLMWTEDWVYGVNTPDNRIVVKNGYFSLPLGSICAFTSTSCTASTGNSQTNTVVDFNQDTLWLSMNVGDTGTRATFSVANGDGYMIPFKRMASAVYALNAGSLGGLTSAQFVQLAPSTVQADASTNATVFLNKTNATGNILTLQRGGTDAFDVDNTGNVLFGANTDKTISMVQAASNVAGVSLAIKAGTGGTGTGAAGGTLTLQGGDGNGTTANGGDVRVFGGSKGTSGNVGNVTLAFDGGSAVGFVGIRKAANTSFALDVSGAIEASTSVNVTANTNQLVLGTTNTSTISMAALSSSQTIKVPNVSGSSTAEFCTSVATTACTSTYATIALNNLASVAINTDLQFAQGATRTINIAQSTTAGNQLTIQAGAGASGANNGGTLLLQGGARGTSGTSGSVIVKANGVDTTAAFSVQNAGATATVLDVDTTNQRVGINTAAPGSLLQANQASLTPGTVSNSASSANVTGSSTTFLTTFGPGDTFTITSSGNTCIVKQVTSDTALVCTVALASLSSASAYSFTQQARLTVSNSGKTIVNGPLFVTNPAVPENFAAWTDPATGKFKITSNTVGNTSTGCNACSDNSNSSKMSASVYNSGTGGTINAIKVYFR